MSNNTADKLRSLFLASLMVFSVFAGSIAFAGSAAAANQATGGVTVSGSIGNSAAISPDRVTEGSTIENHTVRFTVTDVQSGGSDTVNVSYDGLAGNGLEANNLVVLDSGDNAVPVVAGPTVVDNNDDGTAETVQFDLDSSASGDLRVELQTTFTAPEAPSGGSSYDINVDYVDADGDDISGQSVASLSVEDLESQASGFLSGRVSDQNNNDIKNVDVTAVSQSGLTATTSTNAQGEYTLEVPTGTYDITVERPGYSTSQALSNVVEEDSTTTANLVIRRLLVPDQLTATPENEEAFVDGDVTFTATLLDQNGDALNGEDIQASVDDGAVSFAGSQTKGTGPNGQVTFTVTSSVVVPSATVTFEAVSDTSVSNTSTVSFIQRGNGAVDGQVFDASDTEGLPNATVYGVLQSQYETNEYSTSVTLSESGTDADNTVFVRLVDQNTGQIIDNDDYDIRTEDAATTGVTKVEELNQSNASVGEGFALTDVDDNDGTSLDFTHTRLESDDYYLQVSADAGNASGLYADDDAEDFSNYTAGGSVEIFEPSANLTADAAQVREDATDANLVDSTDEDGDFKLTDLYTNFQDGVNYVIIAEKTGFSTDFQETEVVSDGASNTNETRLTSGFNLEPEDVEPSEVDITQVGLHPPLSETGGAPDTDQIDAFENQTDEYVQQVPRDGETIDVIEVTSTNDNGDLVNGTVIVEVEDTDENPTGDEQDFNGTFFETALSGDVVSTGEDTVTVVTGDDGTATVLLETDGSVADFQTNKTAVLANDRSATDNTTTRFVGQVDFQGAAISGIVTDTNDDPVQDSVAYVEQFEFPVNTGDISTQFTIEPVESGASGIDEASDEFNVSRYDDTDDDDEFSDESVTASATVTRSELTNYQFPDEDFPGVDIEITNNDGFKLVDIVELTGAQEDRDASYTLDPVPAVETDAGGSTTDYNVRAVKISEPFAGESRFGQASVQPGSTDDANIVIPIDVTAAEFDVTGLDAPMNATAGDEITVTADVTNTGGSLGNVQKVDFRLDTDGDGQLQSDETLANKTVQIDPGATQQVTFNVSTDGLANDTYTHGVVTNDGQETAQLTVESGSDNGTDGQIEEEDIINAIVELNSGGDVDPQSIIDMIVQYNSQN